MMTDPGPAAPTSGTGAPRLKFEHVSMVFPDGTHALDDVSFNVAPGEFVTVVGPSGCGKSTLLRIASGLTPHTAGTCEVDRDSIGYVFQDATLLPWRTVQRNVELNAELARHAEGRTGGQGRRGDQARQPRRSRGEVPEAALGWHEDALLARPLAGAQPEGLPVRRTVRRPRRDHARVPERRADPAVPASSSSRRCSSPTRSPRRCS